MTQKLERRMYMLYKATHPCVDCGKYDEAELMTFDHVPGRGMKIMAVSDLMRTYPFDSMKVQEEIAKCDLVCALCHEKREAKRGKSTGLHRGIRLRRFDKKPDGYGLSPENMLKLRQLAVHG